MIDQIIDLHHTLCMMDGPLDYHSYTLSDNHAIIPQNNIPKSKLMKHWNALTFHHVQEAVTLGYLVMKILKNSS